MLFTRLNRDGPERRLAHVPDGGGLVRIADDEVRTGIEGGRPFTKPFGLRVGLLGGPRTELDEQRALAKRQQLDFVEPHPLGAKRIGDRVVEPFETDRLVGQDRGHVVGRDERVRKAEAHQTPERGACGEAKRRFEHRDAGAFAADERARDVEAVLGQQFVEVVAGDPARNAGKFRSNQRREAIADALEPGVDLSLPPACRDDGFELSIAGLPDGHARAVVQHHVERVDVVDGLAAHQRVHAARVVADHATQGAAAVRGGVGRKRQVMPLGGVAHAIEHDAGLDPRDLRPRIERDNAVQILRKIHDDRDVAALAGEAGAGAARHDGCAGVAARANGRGHIGSVQRDHQANGDLPVVRRVGGVEGPRAVIEADLAAHRLLQRALEAVGAREPGARMRVRAREGLKHLRF